MVSILEIDKEREGETHFLVLVFSKKSLRRWSPRRRKGEASGERSQLYTAGSLEKSGLTLRKKRERSLGEARLAALVLLFRLDLGLDLRPVDGPDG